MNMRHSPIDALLRFAAALAAVSTMPALAAGPVPLPSLLAATERNRPKVVEHYVDLNSADPKELMTLPGIGTAEADRIIANRPYLTKTELVTKQVLPVGPYLSLKNQVVAMQKFKPAIGGPR
jgi:competence protein ComEA